MKTGHIILIIVVLGALAWSQQGGKIFLTRHEKATPVVEEERYPAFWDEEARKTPPPRYVGSQDWARRENERQRKGFGMKKTDGRFWKYAAIFIFVLLLVPRVIKKLGKAFTR